MNIKIKTSICQFIDDFDTEKIQLPLRSIEKKRKTKIKLSIQSILIIFSVATFFFCSLKIFFSSFPVFIFTQKHTCTSVHNMKKSIIALNSRKNMASE